MNGEQSADSVFVERAVIGFSVPWLSDTIPPVGSTLDLFLRRRTVFFGGDAHGFDVSSYHVTCFVSFIRIDAFMCSDALVGDQTHPNALPSYADRCCVWFSRFSSIIFS